MNWLRSKYKSNTFWVFVRGYLVVFVVPLLVLVFAFIWLSKSMENDTRINYKLTTEQFKSAIDTQLSSIVQFSGKLASEPAVFNFSSQDDLLVNLSAPRSFEVLRDFMSELSSVSATNSAIKNAYVYSAQSDRILSSKGITDSLNYYNISLNNESYTYGEWISRISTHASLGFTNFQFRNNSYRLPDISYVIAISYNDENPISLVLSLNIEQIFQQVESLTTKGAYVSIIYDNTETIFGNSDIFNEIDLSGLSRDENNYACKKFNTSKGEYILSSQYSDVSRCTYNIAMPCSVYYKPLKFIRNIIILALMLILLSGTYLIFLLAKRTYRPIDSILASLKQKNINLNVDESDDFEYIRSVISEISDEKSSIEKQLFLQNNTMSDYLISRLMYGSYYSVSAANDSLNQLGIKFDSDIFFVALIWSDEFFSADEDEVDLIKFVICNVYSELFNESYHSYAVKMDTKCGVLINVNADLLESAYDNMKQIIQKGREFIESHFGVNLYVTISGNHDTLAGIKNAYQEAEQMIERTDAEHSTIYVWEQNNLLRQSACYAFSSELGNKLNNILFIGDEQEAKNLITEENNKVKNTLYKWQYDVWLADLYAAILRSVSAINLENEQETQINNEINNIMQDGKLNINGLCSIIDLICSRVNQKDICLKSSGLAEKVQKYIKDNYSDSELTISEIADYFNLHVNYLSSLYKKRTGESILDTISNYRIAEAKVLLSTTRKRIDDIAKATGYINSTGLIRAFKKYEGITPGQYRIMHSAVMC